MFIVHTFAHVHDRPSQFSAPLSYEQRLFPRWPALSTIISKSFTCDLKKKWNCLMVCSVRKRWKMTQFGVSMVLNGPIVEPSTVSSVKVLWLHLNFGVLLLCFAFSEMNTVCRPINYWPDICNAFVCWAISLNIPMN